MTRQAVEVVCPKCGATASAYPGQVIVHARCPNKGPGAQPPTYQEKKP